MDLLTKLVWLPLSKTQRMSLLRLGGPTIRTLAACKYVKFNGAPSILRTIVGAVSVVLVMVPVSLHMQRLCAPPPCISCGKSCPACYNLWRCSLGISKENSDVLCLFVRVSCYSNSVYQHLGLPLQISTQKDVFVNSWEGGVHIIGRPKLPPKSWPTFHIAFEGFHFYLRQLHRTWDQAGRVWCSVVCRNINV